MLSDDALQTENETETPFFQVSVSAGQFCKTVIYYQIKPEALFSDDRPNSAAKNKKNESWSPHHLQKGKQTSHLFTFLLSLCYRDHVAFLFCTSGGLKFLKPKREIGGKFKLGA